MSKTRKILVLIPISGLLFVIAVYLIMNSRQETRELTDAVRQEAPGKFLKLEHGMVHYRVEGSDTGRLILFIPGGGIPGIEAYAENIPYFTDRGFRVLTYDLYGRGYTDRPRETNNPELFVEQLTQLLDSLQPEGPMDIVSMSLGSMIAIDYAALYPEKVRKMVFIDPTASGDFRPNAFLKIPLISDFLLTAYWYPRAKENQRKEFVNHDVFEKYAARLDYFMNFKGYKFTNHSTWMNMLTHNKLPLLSRLGPDKILLVYGTRDPFFPSGKNAQRYREHYPTLKVDSIENAGHIPHMEKPQEVNEKIYRFLAE